MSVSRCRSLMMGVLIGLLMLASPCGTALAQMPAAAEVDAAEGAVYLATLDRLITLLEALIAFVPVGWLGSTLIILVGAAVIMARLTPTPRDDALVQRLWAIVERMTAESPRADD